MPAQSYPSHAEPVQADHGVTIAGAGHSGQGQAHPAKLPSDGGCRSVFRQQYTELAYRLL